MIFSTLLLNGTSLAEEVGLYKPLFHIQEIPITSWALLKVLLIFILFVVAGKLIERSLRKLSSRQAQAKRNFLYTLSRLLYFFFLVLGIILAGVSVGIDLTALAFIAGALVVWIGFSLQSIFHNLISGILVLLSKDIRVGDQIELESGEKGFVTEIAVRTTILRTLDGLEIVLPNSELVSKKFTNWTLSNQIHRIHVPFKVALNADRERVRELVIEAAKTVPLTIPTKEPEVWLIDFWENRLNFELVVWVNEHAQPLELKMSTQSAYIWAIHTVLTAHDIPLPTTELSINLQK